MEERFKLEKVKKEENFIFAKTIQMVDVIIFLGINQEKKMEQKGQIQEKEKTKNHKKR